MQIIYIADDGKKFTDEEQCQEYEYQKKWEVMNQDIIGFDEKGEVLKYSDQTFPEEVMFITVKTQAAIDNMKDRALEEELPIEGITDPGAYYWDENSGHWEPVETKVEELQEEIEMLRRIINA